MTNGPQNRMWQLTAAKRFEMETAVLPPLADNEVLVLIKFCGLCGSDTSTYEGRRARPYPVSLGHEFVATIECMGTQVSGFSYGDVVVTDFNFRCGICRPCIHDQSHLCEIGQQSAFINRGFATHVQLHSNYLTKIPGRVAAPQYCLVEPLSCVLHAFNHASLGTNDNVLVLGAGSLGTCMALILEDKSISADIFDCNNARLKAVTAAGTSLTAVTDADKHYDVVFDLTGSVEGLKRACRSVRRGGRLISMSHLDGYGCTDFLLSELTRRDVWFIVSYLNGVKDNMRNAIEIINRAWSAEFEKLLNENPIHRLPKIFSNRRVSDANKDIFDLTSWHTLQD